MFIRVICGSFIHPCGRFHPWEWYSLGNISLDLYSHRLHRFSQIFCCSSNSYLQMDGSVVRMENSFDSIYSCSKITSVCRILISMSSEKIICVQMRNLREINTMNNPRVKNIFLFFICHSVILLCNTLIMNKITCWQIYKYLQYLSFICHNM